jgi:hypothetical protein
LYVFQNCSVTLGVDADATVGDRPIKAALAARVVHARPVPMERFLLRGFELLRSVASLVM